MVIKKKKEEAPQKMEESSEDDEKTGSKRKREDEAEKEERRKPKRIKKLIYAQASAPAQSILATHRDVAFGTSCTLHTASRPKVPRAHRD